MKLLGGSVKLLVGGVLFWYAVRFAFYQGVYYQTMELYRACARPILYAAFDRDLPKARVGDPTAFANLPWAPPECEYLRKDGGRWNPAPR